MHRDRTWLVALTGLAFFLLAIASFLVGGEPPDIDKPVEEIVDFYVDNKDSQFAGAILEGLAATLFVFFGAYLRRVLRDAEGDTGLFSALAFAGSIIFAVGLTIDATLTIGLAETAEDIDPAAVQALAALWQNDFIPFAVGTQVFLLGLGLSVVSHGALPKWIGWIALLLAVLAVTPIGFAAFLGAGVLVAILSVMLTMRARGSSASA